MSRRVFFLNNGRNMLSVIRVREARVRFPMLELSLGYIPDPFVLFVLLKLWTLQL